VAVIRVNGIIVESMARRIDGTLRKIEQDKNVKALVVEVDTPGGEVGPSDEIYHRLNQFKENRHLPVVVAMGGFATSGGYYISCAADEIVAQRTTITGNIGVLWPRYNLSKLADKWGIEDNTIYPPDAPYKPMGSELKAMDQKEYEYWLGLVNDAYATFKGVVQTGRAGKLKSGMDVVANGKAYSANESLQMGLIDKIGYAADAYDSAAKLAGLNSKEVVRYEYLPSFLDVLAGGNAQSSSLASAKLMDGGVNVNLKIDREMIDELTTPRLMYIWRGQ
jgi:protease-4